MKTILPPNASRIELTLEALGEVRAWLKVRPVDFWNPATIPAAYLSWLAWSWSVDHWRSDWPEATKRAVIAAAPRVHRLKGTVAAVRAAIAPFGEMVIREWFDDPTGAMPPRTFKVVIAPTRTPTAVEDMVASINSAKPLGAHFTVEQAVPLTGPLALGGVVRVALFRRLTAVGAV